MAITAIYTASTSINPPPALAQAARACDIDLSSLRDDADIRDAIHRRDGGVILFIDVPALCPGMLERIATFRKVDIRFPIIALTILPSVDDAVRIIRAGISDVIDRSSPMEEFKERLQVHADGVRYVPVPYKKGTPGADGQRMVGRSAGITRIRDQISQIAASNANVLIYGESGTGKELVAHLVHSGSPNPEKPFVAVNCAAVPDSLVESELFGHERGAFTGAHSVKDGKLQHASGGTLFLDEIGEMSLLAQAKILRAIESRVIQRLGSNVDTKVDVRLIAATNQDLASLVKARKFREDLYYRLNVIRLVVPPLRERREDIPDLVEEILAELCKQRREPLRTLERDLLDRFQAYDWPGNVRELRNILEAMMVFSTSRQIRLSELPTEIRECLRSSDLPYCNERSRILCALESSSWNREKAAGLLQCSRMTLYRKMTRYSIIPEPASYCQNTE